MQDVAITITSLGGSGENGRNCFLIGTDNGYLLLDCGVKRETVDGQVGIYPSLTRDIVSKIKAVFVSHCHEDHTAALPYLYEMGYKGFVYATAPTINMAPKMIKKWMDYVASKGGKCPFSARSAQLIRYEELKLGQNNASGIPVEIGRSGHVSGGVWFIFGIGKKRILFTGDMTRDPVLLERDEPEKADAAIVNCAYAGKSINQRKQYETLLFSVKESLDKGGKVLLPLPATGRGSDIYLYLSRELKGCDIFVEQAILNECRKLLSQTAWIKSSSLKPANASASVKTVRNDAERKAAADFDTPAVYLSPDGMLTTSEALYYYSRFKSDPNSRIIITGHTAAGTMGANILDPKYRQENQVSSSAEKIIFKVHLDDEDVLWLCEKTKFKQSLLFHANASDCIGLINKLEERKVKAVCMQYPDILSIV